MLSSGDTTIQEFRTLLRETLFSRGCKILTQVGFYPIFTFCFRYFKNFQMGIS